jgi:PAS domain S-box-containing protein
MTGNESGRKKFNRTSIAGWQIIVLYAGFGMAWIIWSDLLVDRISVSKAMSTNMSIIKGCSFVAITSALLYFLLRFYRRNVIESYRRAGTAEHNYRNVFDNNPLPMWIYDLKEFRFLMVNEAAVQKYGYTQEEFLNMSLFDIRPSDDHASLRKNLQEDPNDRFIFSGVWRHVRKDRSIVFVEIDSQPIEYNGIRGRLVVSTDITRMIKAQAELKAIAEELNNFVYRASHDLRGPLARVLGLANLMKLGKGGNDQYVELLSTTARLMDTTLQRLLSVNTLKEYKPNYLPVSLKQMADEIVSVLLETNQVRVPVSNLIDANIVVTSDPKLLHLALESLLDNAIKYRDPSKEVNIEVAAQIQCDCIRISIADNGIGIADAVRPRIFDLFYRGTDLSKGSGLGLYIAQEAVKRQNGRIDLKDYGCGRTVFEVALPIAS